MAAFPTVITETAIMPDPNFVIRYVADPLASARFYAALLGREPVESSPTFTMFVMTEGVMLGLWARRTVEPTAPPAAPDGELAFSVADEAAVTRLHREWSGHGHRILQAPTRMDFGYTFVAADPDGHRLRVFAPAG